ncbi:MAG TPA: carboxyl transferase domain-containing protein, partial [Kofleriaceae bacterium]|nr:carboxyl transferase domain-containing protein [Kofleriaceae bacterium]
GRRMSFWRLAGFDLQRLPSVEDVYLYRAVARDNPKDERLFAMGEVRDLTPVRDAEGRIVQLPYLERVLGEALAALRRVQAERPARDRLQWNRVILQFWEPLRLRAEELDEVVRRLAPATEGLGIEQVMVYTRVPSGGLAARPPDGADRADGAGGAEGAHGPAGAGSAHGAEPELQPRDLREVVLRISNTLDGGLHVRVTEPPAYPLATLTEYEQKVISLRRRGLIYPYEIVRLLTPPDAGGGFPRGDFVEHDLDDRGALVPVHRRWGENTANIVVGVLRSFTAEVPEGIERVALFGDANKEMGSLAEPECRRIMAALDLAEQRQLPLEWFALSAGAKISRQSGTENMDWISAVLRRIIEFTQRRGEINVVVCGINVGAQPYWNAEATMLMHTRGILIMIGDSAMVLTGKQALDYSGSTSAEDNQGIGGYERIMGPNGQAQYWAPDIGHACKLLLRHYAHTYVVPGERFPRAAVTADARQRDVRDSPHPGDELPTIGDVFGPRNADRKRPFDIRAVMRAVADADHEPLERWRDLRDGDIGVIWDAHLAGVPVCMIGIESHALPRRGFIPGDGPVQWTSGTLFPRGSKKIARAVNAASGNRPLVVIANLAGFDGSPESMRELQLEYGAEIGRAVVNFDGPIVFCVVSRYHGGAFVVFSKKLNENLEVLAVEGARASVIGGAPAAAVVFSRDVDTRTAADERLTALEAALAAAPPADKAALRNQLAALRPLVRSEKLGQVADEFDQIHSIERALRMGSIDRIVPVAELRPSLIAALERGMARTLRHWRGQVDGPQS